MAEGHETSHDRSVATPAAATVPGDLHPAIAELIGGPKAGSPKIESPKIESPPIQPQVVEIAKAEPPQVVEILRAAPPPIAEAVKAEPAPLIVAADTPSAPEGAKSEPPKSEPKMPPVVHLAEVAPAASPPPFLREHATRVIAAKPPLRADPRPAGRPEPKTAPKTERAPGENPRQTRFALLAASVAICACLGAALGTAGIAGVAGLGRVAPLPPRAGATAEVQALREQIAQLGTDLAAARTTIEHLNRASDTRFGKIVERFDRAEKAQGDPAAKLAKITDALDRLEKRLAALPVTPAPAPVAALAPPPAPQNDVVGSITPRPAPEAKAPPKPQILENFVLRRVYDGIAIIEGRNGMIEVEPGQSVPGGGGRVEDIKRQDGHWVVVTSKGLIVSQRDR
jgi:hypothetical protein